MNNLRLENNGGIYSINSIVDGKFYIGSSVHIKNRWKRHLSYLRKGNHTNIHLQRAWNKYGQENFTFNILENTVNEELLNKEQEYIDKLQANIKGYNLSPTAGSRLGFKQPQSFSKALSKRMLNNVINLGRKHTEEARKNMKLSKAKFIGIPLKKETLEKIRKSNIGKHQVSEDRRKILSDAMINRAILYEYKGKKQSLKLWAVDLSISIPALRKRLKKWTLEEVFGGKEKIKLYEYQNIKKTLREWAEEYHIKYDTLHHRLANGWSFEEALVTKAILGNNQFLGEISTY